MGVWVIWFGLEFLDHHGKLSTYPSSKPTLTLISHLGQNVGLGEGYVESKTNYERRTGELTIRLTIDDCMFNCDNRWIETHQLLIKSFIANNIMA